MSDLITLDDLIEPAPEPGPHDWNDDGFIIHQGLVPDDLIEAYTREWLDYNVDRRDGWPDATPYMRHDSLRALCCDAPLAHAIEALIGEPAGVHLNLTGWVSTERNFHQDGYLNPPHVGDYYAAAWIALDDIHPDSGPLELVPGSHRWFTLTQERIGRFVNMADPMWPKHTEEFLTSLIEEELDRRGVETYVHLPKRGDVLLWHPRLLHRGSAPNVPGTERRALIAHYSGINHRQDMPAAVRHERGGWFFPLAGGRVR